MFFSSLMILAAGLHFYTWIASLSFTSISSSVVLVTTQPVFVAILGYVFLKEKIGATGSVAVVLAIIGSYLIARGDFAVDSVHLKGDILAIAGALAAAAYLFIGRFVRRRVNLIPYVLTVYSVASTVILILGLITGTFKAPAVKIDYLIFFLLALGPTILRGEDRLPDIFPAGAGAHNTGTQPLQFRPAAPAGIPGGDVDYRRAGTGHRMGNYNSGRGADFYHHHGRHNYYIGGGTGNGSIKDETGS
jgi:hypothetical protein